jgi:hypothetical protein
VTVNAVDDERLNAPISLSGRAGLPDIRHNRYCR